MCTRPENRPGRQGLSVVAPSGNALARTRELGLAVLLVGGVLAGVLAGLGEAR